MLSSLRARLFGWLLLPLLGFLVVSGALSYASARRTASLLEDNMLLASARMMAEAVYWQDGALIGPVPPAALELFESPYQDHVYYRLTARPIVENGDVVGAADHAGNAAVDGNSRLLAGTPNLPERPGPVAATGDHPELSAPSLRAPIGESPGNKGPNDAAPGSARSSDPSTASPRVDEGGGPPRYFDTTFNEQSVRAVAYDRLVYDAGRTDRVTVVVAKTRESTEALVETLWHPQLWRQVLLACLALLLVPIGLTIELRPLLRLRADVTNRDPTTLAPLRTTHLHAELRPIVETINQTLIRLKQQASTQRQFIADAAHQMRTPLTVLDTQLQYLQQAGPTSPGWHDALAGLQRTSRRMASMTDQLLMLAQAEAATRQPLAAKVDLAAVIADVLAEMLVNAERRGIDLGAEWGTASPPESLGADGGPPPIFVQGNAGLLTALVLNLVDNAIRYTASHMPTGGHVTVSCRYAYAATGQELPDPSQREVILMVSDNGPGIPAEARAHVFERFYRLHGEADSEGSGLGLAIVEQITRAHRGAVTLASAPRASDGAYAAVPGLAGAPYGAGLCVTVRLPAWREEEQI